MNIDNLIRTLCPEGVKRVRLESLLDYEQPTPYIVKDTQYDNSHSTPVLTAGQSFILGYTDETDGVYRASKENSVIIFDDFTTSSHWVDFDFKVKSSAMKMLRPKTTDSFRYIYYCIKSINFIPSEHTRHWISKYSQFEIPLPPLPVQEAIVSYLDKLTSLTAELEAELELQKKRYDFYRNRLLSFAPDPTTQFGARLSNNGDYHKGPLLVKWAKLGDVFEMRNGYTPSKNNPAFWEGGTIPWFRMEDIRENGHILSDAIQHITAETVKGKGLFEANSFILATTATIGEHALLIADSLANQRFTNLKIRKSLKDSFLTKFVFYYMFVVDDFCKKHTNKSGFESVDMEALRNMPFPLPPLSEQERIVGILDKYETLVNDTRQGIPALIAAVQRKYEYYRERLLTF